MKSDGASVLVKHSSDITPEQARDARACAWAFIFDCHAKKKAARPGDLDAGKEINERSGKLIIPK